MAVILSLKKTGVIIKTHTKQSVSEVWELITGINPNSDVINRYQDFLLLLDKFDNPVIINKRYIFRIDEN